LIEDNPADARLIKENLRDVYDNFHLEWKERLSSGLEFLAKSKTDVILADLSLPDSQGLDTFTKINEKFSEKPIIVLTGLDDKELANQAVREGAQDYLVKGEVDGRLLGRSIGYAIERKKSQEALHVAQINLEKKVIERTSELKDRYEEIEQLIYAVSHDLMVPLVTITGFIGFLKKDVAAGNRLRIEIDLGLVEDAAERMEDLLSRTLELSSINSMSNPKELVPFAELVFEALSQTKKEIKSSRCEIKIAEDLPKVNVDRPRIVDVLVNIINNSLKYAGSEKPARIEIGHLMNGTETEFYVKDEGVGIDPAMQKDVFKLFHKGSEDGRPDVGMGLSRRIIEAHGGRMWIESEPKEGCTVYFTLP
jgi:K+-sensing histidine kinase KdpD